MKIENGSPAEKQILLNEPVAKVTEYYWQAVHNSVMSSVNNNPALTS